MTTLLLATVLLPLAAAMLPGRSPALWRRWTLGAALLSLAGAIVLVYQYPGGQEPFAAIDVPWLTTADGDCPDFRGEASENGTVPLGRSAAASLDVRFSMALDGLSLWLFALTALLSVVAVLVGWEAIRQQQSLYYRLLLILETGMLGAFVARDIILFYLFFEFTLVPLFFLIGIWGSDQRRHAAIKFFIFTLSGSVLALLGLLAIVLWVAYGPSAVPGQAMTFSIPELTARLADHPMPVELQLWIFAALFAGFAIKVPLPPLHTWLPLAHVEAPAAGSVLLAGVLLKIGAYGFVRFNLPMLPEATARCMPWLLVISVAGIVYGSLVALAQTDLKRLIAYSSVSHMGFCMLGIFAVERLGTQGGALQLINHGLATGGLFALVGMLYERYHTRQIADFGGIARQTPVLAFFMVFMALASIGLPGLGGFVGELFALLGMFQRAWAEPVSPWTPLFRTLAVLATSGVVLGAWYMLSLVRRVFFGPPRETKHAEPIGDLKLREVAALAPLAAMIVWIGVQPRFFLDRMAPTLDALTAPVTRAVDNESLSSRAAAPRPVLNRNEPEAARVH